jgi:hypothetical protein
MILKFEHGKKDAYVRIISYLFSKLGKHQAPGLFGMPIPVLAFSHLGLEDLLLARVLSQDLLPCGHPLGRERHFLGGISTLVGGGKITHDFW